MLSLSTMIKITVTIDFYLNTNIYFINQVCLVFCEKYNNYIVYIIIVYIKYCIYIYMCVCVCVCVCAGLCGLWGHKFV